MKKFVFLTLTFLFIYVESFQAQVIIGRTDPPHPAAVMEIESSNMGLLLPNVALNSDSTQFVLSGGNSSTATGMIVYNTANVQEGRGVYFWDGTRWHALGLSRTPSPSPLPSPSQSPSSEVVQADKEEIDLQQTTANKEKTKKIK